jgi:hypothetical protein
MQQMYIGNKGDAQDFLRRFGFAAALIRGIAVFAKLRERCNAAIRERKVASKRCLAFLNPRLAQIRFQDQTRAIENTTVQARNDALIGIILLLELRNN